MRKIVRSRRVKFLIFFAALAIFLGGCGSNHPMDDYATNKGYELEKEKTGKDKGIPKEKIKVGVIHISDPAEGSGYTYTHDIGIQQMQENLGLMDDQIVRKNNIADTDAEATEKAMEECLTLQHLKQINKEVENSIATITRQTNLTNESAQRIRSATEIISSIAEETSLLSLNASIEAAKAGESGRGFAVVASQIQKLAEQSNESSSAIEEITHTLIENSDEAVVIMGRVREIIESQTKNMLETQNIVSEVTDGIEVSLEKIEQIGTTTIQLEVSRNRIVENIEGLSDIAEQNAAGTQQTFAQTVEVTNTFEEIEDSAANLKKIADELSDMITYFQLDI